MAPKRIVIVGNSAAGLSALETVRRVDRDCSISLVSKETGPAYSKVMTPHLISGDTPDIFIRTMEYYRQMGAETLFGTEAVRLEDGRLVLEGGRTLSWDRLLLATGSSAAVPDIEGIHSNGVITTGAFTKGVFTNGAFTKGAFTKGAFTKGVFTKGAFTKGAFTKGVFTTGVFTLKTMEDALRIREYVVGTGGRANGAKGAKRALLIGGGLVCLLVVRAFWKLGLELTIAVSSDRLLSRMLDREASGIVRDRLEESGVKVHTATDIREILSKEGRVQAAVSRSGEEFPADIIIIAKGVRSNVGLARESGIPVSRGILVDQYMRTGRENVYAAGDAAESPDMLIRGKQTICATWFEAVHQGEIAGYNMAGLKRPSMGSLKMNVMETMGVPIASIGEIGGSGETAETVVTRRNGVYRKLVLRDDRIVGAVLMGDVEDAGVIATMIRRKLRLSSLGRINLKQRFRYAGVMRV
ncbi:MAG TPA: FAD-dependent oxidoreductase [Spirochaetia bacterium]|nr:FAD-dependent oxidoreductase [Spirochaetia bacterium]